MTDAHFCVALRSQFGFPNPIHEVQSCTGSFKLGGRFLDLELHNHGLSWNSRCCEPINPCACRSSHLKPVSQLALASVVTGTGGTGAHHPIPTYPPPSRKNPCSGWRVQTHWLSPLSRSVVSLRGPNPLCTCRFDQTRGRDERDHGFVYGSVVSIHRTLLGRTFGVIHRVGERQR